MLHHSSAGPSELSTSVIKGPQHYDGVQPSQTRQVKLPNLQTSYTSLDGSTKLSNPIHIRAFHDSPSSRPFVLQPTLVLHRSQIPLGILVGGGILSSKSRAFRATIACLDALYLDPAYDSSNPPVLVACSQEDDTLFFIEKIHNQIHTLSQLVRWASLALLEALPAAGTIKAPLSQAGSTPKDDSQWWSKAAIPDHPFERLTKRQRVEPQQISHPENTANGTFNDDQSAETLPPVEIAAPGNAPSPTEAFNTIVSQYLEFLYLSKSSLAFFAKGPLSRARASFLSANESTPQLQEYLDLLSSMILEFPVMDKKYRETLTAYITSSLKDSLAKTTSKGPKALKKIGKKKLKLSKEGTYSMEVDYLTTWLQTDEPPSPADDMTSRLKALQLREMLLQITVLLEIQAIMSAMSPVVVSSVPETTAAVGQENLKTKTGKSKRPKQRDFRMALDLLVDRLCIWQSVDQSDDTERSRPPSRGLEGTGASKDTSHQMKDFCTDVIIPLFASRVPDQAYKVSSKLGGPRQPSSVKKSKSRHSQASHRVVPGSRVIRKLVPDGSTTATPTEANSKTPASLSRQSSSTVSHDVKSEVTERSLFDFPARDIKRPLSRSGSINHTRRFSQREVDISATFKASDTKARKKPNVQQELKAAIETLKKPNRNQAVRDYFKSADQRQAVPSKPIKRSNVEVDATPKKRKAETLIDAVTPQAVKLLAPSPEQAFVPASVIKKYANVERVAELDVVPSSIKPASKRFVETGEQTVLETPSRGLSKLTDPLGTLQAANSRQPDDNVPIEPEVPIYQSLGWDDDIDELS